MAGILNIYEALLNRKEKICPKKEILELINEYNIKISRIKPENAIKYLTRHKYIKRIFQQFYYINSMDERKRDYCTYKDKELLFIVLNKLKIRWYLGLSNALYILGRSWQTPNALTIINNKMRGNKKILGLSVIFIKIKKSLIFNLKQRITKNGVGYYYSDLTKTYLDMVYLKKSNELNRTKDTKKYMEKYPKWISKK